MFKVFPLLLCVFIIDNVSGYIRLHSPPARSSLWRYGYDSLPNYDDVMLDCGGIEKLWKKNDGKCGVCGDAFDTPKPRKYETGGESDWKIITRRYFAGEVIDAIVYVRSNMRGFFEFRVCPMSDPDVEVTQECLDQHILDLAYEPGSKFILSTDVNGVGIGYVAVPLRLPKDLTCSHCVFQMTYIAGNSWTVCYNRTEAEECSSKAQIFKNCADISIAAPNSNTTSVSDSDSILIPLDTDVKYGELPEKSIQVLLKLSKYSLAMMNEGKVADEDRAGQDDGTGEEYEDNESSSEYNDSE